MDKKYRLPKEFAIKWLEALRSGKYEQGLGNLFKDNKYCCIGVAGSICDVSNSLMNCRGLFSPSGAFPEELIPTLNIPKELIGPPRANSLVKELTSMNDGTNYPKEMNFKEIADWIETNCEFYD